MIRYIACALVPLTLAAFGCSKSKPPPAQLGEPVGAQVPARASLPAFSIAFAVTKGKDPIPLLAPLVSAVSSATAGCPTLAADAKDEITAFDFKIDKGKMQVPPRPTPAGAKCLSSALDGKDLGAADTTLDARVELKMTGPTKP
jgi:hypothetical protein